MRCSKQGIIMLSHSIWDPDNKVHGANMGPNWDRQDPGGPHVGPMNFAIWGVFFIRYATEKIYQSKNLLPGTRIGMILLEDCGLLGLSIIRLLQLLSEPRKGPMPGPLALNLTYPLLGNIGPLTGNAANTAGHAAMLYNVPLVVMPGALTR